MKVRIGMLIWREMKEQGYSQAKFIAILREKNVYIKDLFKIESIDVYALIQISAVLNKNFFVYYEPEELLGLLKADKVEEGKVSALKALNKAQDTLLLTHQKMIKQQDNLIRILKSSYLEE